MVIYNGNDDDDDNWIYFHMAKYNLHDGNDNDDDKWPH